MSAPPRAALLLLSPLIALQFRCAPAPAPQEPQPAQVAIVQLPGAASPLATPSPQLASDNAVIQACETYRKAVEARDATAILALASPNYHDTAGTDDPADDIDYDGLREYLQTQFKSAEQIRYEMRYSGVRWEDGLAHVAVTYSAAYKVGAQWIRKVGDNEIVLEQRNGTLLIVRGM